MVTVVEVVVGVTVVEGLAVVVVVELFDDVEVAPLVIAVKIDEALILVEVFEIIVDLAAVETIFVVVDNVDPNVTDLEEVKGRDVVFNDVVFVVNEVVSEFFAGSDDVFSKSSPGHLAKEAHSIKPNAPKHIKIRTGTPMFRDDGDEFARLKDFFVESPNILEKKKKTQYSNRQLSKLNT